MKKRLDYDALDRPIMGFTVAELRQKFPPPYGKKKNETTKAKVFRSIIMNQKKFMPAVAWRGLRKFWYNTAKPVLEKLGFLDRATMTKNQIDGLSGELSAYMAGLFRNNELTYKQLKIRDESRKRDVGVENTESISLKFEVPISGGFPNIVLATEKDSSYSVVQDVAFLFGTSCISGSGEPSLSAAEDFIRSILDYREEQGWDTIYVLSFTDYDPLGFDIDETFEEQFKDVLENIVRETEAAKGVKVKAKRLGIKLSQLSPDEIESNKYTPSARTETEARDWFNKTGGINGEYKGLELDALDDDKIKKIFIESLRPYIDPTLYKDNIKEAYIKQVTLDLMKDSIEETLVLVLNSVAKEFKVEDFDLFKLAEDGHEYVPVDELCSPVDESKEAEDIIREELEKLFPNE